MSAATNQTHLREQQYRNAANLNARLALHARFSVNGYGWHRWVFDQFDMPSPACVLELGCGPGTLWLKNAERIPQGWEVLLSDFSPGMLDDARRNLATVPHPFAFQQFDAQAIPLPDSSLDAIIANHMLYHVPNRARAFAEIRRVLKPNGILYAATNGCDHLRELSQLQERVGFGDSIAVSSEAFSLENGEEQLAPWFAHVGLRRYEDGLHVTKAEPLVAYILSEFEAGAVGEEQKAAITAFVESELARLGVLKITKSTGLFLASQHSLAIDRKSV